MEKFRELTVAEVARAQAVHQGKVGPASDGFLTWRDASLSPEPASLAVVTDTDKEGWFRYVNDRRVEVGPLGCHELADIDLYCHAILWHGDAFITVPSHLGEIDAQQARAMTAEILQNERVYSDRPGIVVAGNGHMIFGHWLVDFLPRLWSAKALLGDEFRDYVIPLPSNTPDWVYPLMERFCGVSKDQVLLFDLFGQHVHFKRLLVPAYAHADYPFHPAIREMWPEPAAKGFRKLCISRKNFEKATFGVRKRFCERQQFEQAALERGYEIVYPETLGLEEQIALFSEASHVVGEYGSALHSMLYAPKGSVVGMIRCPNDVQLRISALKEQKSVLLFIENEWLDEEGVQVYSVAPHLIEAFFDAMEAA